MNERIRELALCEKLESIVRETLAQIEPPRKKFWNQRKKKSNSTGRPQKIKNWNKEFDLVALFLLVAYLRHPHPSPLLLPSEP
jgi:hypothetical protein